MIFATQDKDFFPADLAEKLIAVRDFGFDKYEATGSVFLNHYDELIRATEKSGVAISTVCSGDGGFIGDFDEEKRLIGISNITAILETGTRLNISGIILPAAWGMCTLRLPPHTAPRSTEDDRITLHKSLSFLDKVAHNTGTWIYFEPLNRYEDHMVNTQQTAKDIITEGGYSRVKTTADLYHMNIEEKNVVESFKMYAKQIGHVHICDSNRSEPGEGHIDFIGVFSALKQVGYEGILAFEGRVTGVPEAESYKNSLVYIKDCWDKSCG